MARRVLLHVGTPKTGTTYLQDVCFRNRPLLEEHGILYPADRFDAHFLAALDLMRLPWGGLEEQAVGAWDRLAAEVRAFDGTAIVSHEILARATPAQTRRALASLGHGDGSTEVHLVLSVRDLVRQIPAEWQENIKHRTTTSYADFLAELQEQSRSGIIASWFWAVQELPDIVDRWRHDLPADRVHLVTVPPPGSPRDLLWERFVTTFGLAGLDLDLGTDRANVSLGVPETYLLRQVNLRANDQIEPADYRELIREVLAHRTLSARTGSPRLALPPTAFPWISELTDRWVEELSSQGYDVVGSLAELSGERPAAFSDPDAPDLDQVVDAAAASIVALVHDVGRWRANEARLHAEIADLHGQLARARMNPVYRLKERLYRLLTRGRTGQRVLDAYYRARGSSSRLA
ncbi:hypothetical protein P5P86_02310 [Nocardioides sp. BP30]|uniref:hypothetical protein n=1 Tax=Nocardioides sp. BP30 TaxID=3036374 RepID=UPI002469A4E5|nr:hypothetical protein [Nocardioides sp. BP30]WGL52667.1 hypothetical protein P5P86_02310 [Nocardioides sp. BP30]